MVCIKMHEQRQGITLILCLVFWYLFIPLLTYTIWYSTHCILFILVGYWELAVQLPFYFVKKGQLQDSIEGHFPVKTVFSMLFFIPNHYILQLSCLLALLISLKCESLYHCWVSIRYKWCLSHHLFHLFF